jgi:hypothetical protein
VRPLNDEPGAQARDGGDFGDERDDRFPGELVVLEPEQPDGAGQQVGPERCGTEANTCEGSRDGELRDSQ